MLIPSAISALGDGGIITILLIIIVLIVWIVSAHHKLKDLEPVREHTKSLAKAAELIPKIYGMLLNHYGTDIFKATSPVSLTDYGKSLSQEIDAQFLVEKYKEEIKKETANMNAYEIQQYCFDFAENKVLDDLKKTEVERFNKITELAYQQGVDVEKIMRVLGLELRDSILGLVGKTHQEVDDNSPED